MAQADSINTTSRRAVLAGIATISTVAAPALALSGAAPDPIFAAIERHRSAHAAYIAAIDVQGDMEVRLVDEQLAAAGSPEKCSDRWYKALDAATHDPQYLGAKETCNKSSEAESAAAWALIGEPAVTVAGAAALAAYALEYKLSDISWPPNPDHEEGQEGRGEFDDYATALLRSLKSTLSVGAVS
jgi:hypothetical protein